MTQTAATVGSERAHGNILSGFAEPVSQSQASFRAVLDAMARPGTVHSLPSPEGVPDGWPPALAALALTLLDQETDVWLDSAARTDQAVRYLRFHCGCRIIQKSGEAAFAIVLDAEALSLTDLAIGDPLYPERSTTLLLCIDSLSGGSPMRWTGPGIQSVAKPGPRGLPTGFVQAWRDNRALYPSGVDVVLVAGEAVIGLPRGVAVEED